MSDSTKQVAREIYCEVLFELAEEASIVDEVHQDLTSISQIMVDQPEFAAMINSPAIKGQEKSEAVRRIFKGHITDLTLDFVSVLARRNRMALLTGIYDRYETLVDKHYNRVAIEASVPYALDDDAMETLKKTLSEAVNNPVKLTVNVAPDMIGGIIIRKDDKVIDNSVRTALRRAVKTVIKNIKLSTI
jgi:F-type H+-transporting ATPase subunit delta